MSAGTPTLKSSTDLSHVIGFGIEGATCGRELGPCPPTTLYAIRDDGSVAMSSLFDESGTCTPVEGAIAVVDTPDYDVISYDTTLGALPCDTVIVRKSDGSLVCDNGGRVMQAASNASTLYLLRAQPPGSALELLDLSRVPPTSSVASNPLLGQGYFDALDVDAAGDALVGSSSYGVALYIPASGVQTLSNTGETFQWYSPDDGKLYYTLMSGSGSLVNMDSYALSPGTMTPTAVGSFTADAAGSGPLFFQLTPPLPTAAQAIALGSSNGHALVELLGPTAGTVHHEPGILNEYLTRVRGNGTHFFTEYDAVQIEAGPAVDSTIVVDDITTFAEATVLPSGTFAVHTFALSRSGELTLVGTRLADSAHVLATCETTTGCTVVDANAPALTSIVRF